MGKTLALISGALLLLLGFASGVFLILSPLGLIDVSPGMTLWIFFPVLTMIGYLFLAMASRETSVPALTQVAGTLSLCLGLSAIVILFLASTAVVKPVSDTFALWYVLVLGMVFGATGLSFRSGKDTKS